MTESIMTRTCQDFAASSMVVALESTWATIRSRHFDVPPAVMVLAPAGPTKPADGLRLGHYASLRWQQGDHRLSEVLVSGEGLQRPPTDVLVTLLHEAAHGIADVRGVQDTSRQGRWHNRIFANLAGEVGIIASRDDRLGWSPCTLPSRTRTAYADQLGQLEAAMSAWRWPDEQTTRKRANSNNGLSLTCQCPRRIRVATSTVEEGPIVCGACGTPFLTDDQRQAGVQPAGSMYDPTGEHHNGIPSYPYKLAPTGVATRRQLRQRGLRPGGQPIAAQILWRNGRRLAHLYRLDLAVPKRTATPAQRSAIDRALLSRRTCPKCLTVRDYYISRRDGACHDCSGKPR
jgi:hypothetical protein